MLGHAIALLWVVGGVHANELYERNVNFLSASQGHSFLGLDRQRLFKRQLAPPVDSTSLNFTHGVASGDPAPDSVILWTRLSPQQDNDRSNVTVEGLVELYDHDNEQYIETSTAPICADYRVAIDEAFASVVDSGRVYTTSEIDYTIKVEAKNLSPFTRYYYQFSACDGQARSPVGRTKTLPDPDDDADNVRLAVYSCANWPFGFFNAYGNVARKDSVDYVVHLGDYIYEYGIGSGVAPGSDIGRIHVPSRDTVSLYDYRRRLGLYREDPDLLASHQSFPWIPVWDDHEVANDAYRDGSGRQANTFTGYTAAGNIAFDQRKMNAVRAYFEWMPIRQVDLDDNLRIWRSFSLGKLADLVMLDTREYDRSITNLDTNAEYITAISNDAGRSLMGPRQEKWFYRTLRDSASRGATWRIVGSQVIFSQINRASLATLRGEEPFNRDSWDGYRGNRNRTFQTLYDNGIGNNLFIAGDSHANWVSDLIWEGAKSYDPETGEGSIGAEFAVTAVSSVSRAGAGVNVARAREISDDVVGNNTEIKWNEFWYRGYMELSLGREQAEARYFGIPNVKVRSGLEVSLANFTVRAGGAGLDRPVGGGVVEAGTLSGGETRTTNRTVDTEPVGGGNGTLAVRRFRG
ncbi:Alkaline phosphatase D [Sphaceloma murrayae]|uniref:Alkaline phosphatase D n=1 Tax=Sphaceloma murrayae TaxID=2082308 RepID=A0A2K1QSE3_9PEZI|nr:Alkaline phosphatase D [Sphaceloma murrayae]